nr:carboxypeptidase s1 like b [Quercus suber]
MKSSVALAVWLSSVTLSVAQFPPTPEGITTLQSKHHPHVSISYKQPGICETTPGVKSYSGYVHLPPSALDEPHEQNLYPINTFFWFFEARHDPANAPLSIWLNGGPGGSSLMGALSENGPCFVNDDSNSTYLNPWSWNNEVNLLYIDQPVQVGFSYDTLTNITAQLRMEKGDEDDTDWKITPADFSRNVPEQNNTFLVGTTGSQNVSFTANSTHHAAVAIWHFAQTWFEEFPEYKPADEQISLFTESYGGKYGPTFVRYFLQQNEKIDNGTLSGDGVHYLRLNTVGIINGCIDIEVQLRAYVDMAVNNTYGIEAMSDIDHANALHHMDKDGGIIAQLQECHRLERELDPDDDGDVETVSSYCRNALEYGMNYTVLPYEQRSKRGWFDVTHPAEDAFPPPYLMGFLNQHWVQRALGVPVNHSAISNTVYVRHPCNIGEKNIANLCSLAIPWNSQQNFSDAGYTPLVLNHGVIPHSGGLVRQYGNLSFTRVYQAGHLVPSYQPEAAYEIFMRALRGQDIATGTVSLDHFHAKHGIEYSTEGPGDTWWMRSDVLPAPKHECYIFDTGRCSETEKEWLMDGSAIVKDWIVVGREQQHVDSGTGWPISSAEINGNHAQVVMGDKTH